MRIPKQETTLRLPKRCLKVKCQNILFYDLSRKKPASGYHFLQAFRGKPPPGRIQAKADNFTPSTPKLIRCLQETGCRIARPASKLDNQIGLEFQNIGGELGHLVTKHFAHTFYSILELHAPHLP